MLVCLSASHKNAPFALLEQLSSSSAELTSLLAEHVASESISGATVVATCNRFEAYIDAPDEGAAVAAVTDAVNRVSGVDTALVAHTLRTLGGHDVAEHLFAVAAGLESVIVGEGEIAGQVKRSLEQARAAGTTTSDLERLFQAASRTSRSIKNSTPLGSAGRSIVRLALDLAESRIVSWHDASALIVGTGAYAGASLAALRARGVTDVAVYSPSRRAEAFAASHGIRPVSDAEFPQEVARSTIVITCTSSIAPVLDASTITSGRLALARGFGSLPRLGRDDTPGCPVNHDARQIVLDLGLPRNVAPDVATVAGVELLDLETVRIHAPLEELQATDTARAMVSSAVHSFARASDELALTPAVVALRERAMTLLEEEVARVAPRDPDGTAERALRHMMGRLMHKPAVRAREYARAGEHQRYLDALETLFGIEVSLDAATEMGQTRESPDESAGSAAS